jgi:hypothetical protein
MGFLIELTASVTDLLQEPPFDRSLLSILPFLLSALRFAHTYHLLDLRCTGLCPHPYFLDLRVCKGGREGVEGILPQWPSQLERLWKDRQRGSLPEDQGHHVADKRSAFALPLLHRGLQRTQARSFWAVKLALEGHKPRIGVLSPPLSHLTRSKKQRRISRCRMSSSVPSSQSLVLRMLPRLVDSFVAGKNRFGSCV